MADVDIESLPFSEKWLRVGARDMTNFEETRASGKWAPPKFYSRIESSFKLRSPAEESRPGSSSCSPSASVSGTAMMEDGAGLGSLSRIDMQPNKKLNPSGSEHGSSSCSIAGTDSKPTTSKQRKRAATAPDLSKVDSAVVSSAGLSASAPTLPRTSKPPPKFMIEALERGYTDYPTLSAAREDGLLDLSAQGTATPPSSKL